MKNSLYLVVLKGLFGL